jgi:outer membrane protein assembly factor BamB
MKRILVLFVLVAVCSFDAAWATGPIPQEELERHGLERAWFTQITAHGALATVEHVALDGELLLVQTRNGVLDAIEADSGRIRWSQRLGEPLHPSLAPSGNSNFVATINGRTAYVMNRFTGDVLWSRKFDGVPGAGPVLGESQLFIPMTNGSVLAFPVSAEEKREDDPLAPIIELVEEKELTETEKVEIERKRQNRLAIAKGFGEHLVCQSFGRIHVQPVSTTKGEGRELVAWQTDRGSVYLGRLRLGELKRFLIVAQIAVRSEVAARMSWVPNVLGEDGLILFGTADGVVWAVSDRTGESVWHFPTNQPISEQVVAVGDAVFAPTDLGGMVCLEVSTGKQRWWTSGLAQFVAASKDRVYAVDLTRRVVVLDISTGRRISAFDASRFDKAVNPHTDRIFLTTSGGMVQCIHEIGLTEPLRHVQRPEEKPSEEMPPPGEEQPAETPDSPSVPEANPFQTQPPAEEPNPFSSSSDYDPFAEM